MELLIWIPKRADARTTEGQRPLQMLTRLRMLVGAVTAQLAAPVVEPTLSCRQAARRWGSCRGNISTAVQLLGGQGEPMVEQVEGRLEAIDGLLGPFAAAWREAPDGNSGL